MRRSCSILAAFLLLGCAPRPIPMQDAPRRPYGRPIAATMERTVERKYTVRYLVHLPADYDPEGKERPLILFLHGAGERGEDFSKISNLGPLKYAKAHRDFPFIVVAPQCPMMQEWSPDELGALLDEVVEKYAVDEHRVYLTGFSMGGWGTWQTAMRMPGRFAAIAPLCGRTIPLLVGNIWRMPVWVFHGDNDPVVPIRCSEEMMEYFRGVKNENAKFTVYKGAPHEIWDRTYDNPELYTWFLGHRREK